MNRTFWLSLLLSLVCWQPAFADSELSSCYTSGNWAVCEWLLCSGDHTPTPTTCTEFDLHSGPSGFNGFPGLPEHVVAEVRTDNCTNKTIGRLQGMSSAGGTAHDLSTDMQLGSATTHVVVNPVSHRLLRFNITTPGTLGTCDTFEVVLRSFNRRFNSR